MSGWGTVLLRALGLREPNHVPVLLAEMRRHKLTPQLRLVDVGASGGIDSLWRILAPVSTCWTFDPDHRQLDVAGVHHISCALGAQDEEREILLTQHPAASSMLAHNRNFLASFPNLGHHDVVGKANARVHRLDDVMTSLGVDLVDFIKVDAEGMDLDVLRGASSLIDRWVGGIQLEAKFQPTNVDMPLFPELHAHLVNCGYALFGLRREHWKRRYGPYQAMPRGQFVWADCLYFLELGPLCERLARLPEASRMVCARNAVFLIAAYGYFDYALQCLEAMRDCGLMAVDETRGVEAALLSGTMRQTRLRRWLSVLPYPLRAIMATITWHLFDAIRPHGEGFAVTDLEF